MTSMLRDFPDTMGAPYTAPGGPAVCAEGVHWYAPWEDPFTGFPEHSRRQVEALALVENVQLLSIAPRIRYEQVDDSPEDRVWTRMKPHLDRTVGNAWAQIYSVVPSEGFVAGLTSHRFLSRADLAAVNMSRVVYLVLERDRVSATMARGLDQMGQVWTTCDKSARALITSGVAAERVRIVPMPYRWPDEPRLTRQTPPRNDVPRFLHIGKWEPRKAQDRMFRAFMQAFRPLEAKLTVKTGSGFYKKTDGYPDSPNEALKRALHDPAVTANGWTWGNVSPSIRVFTDHLSDAGIDDLHRWCDCYVSLAYGEGWDMPAFDACLQGDLLIYTKSGGPEMFAPHGSLAIANKGLNKPDSCYDWGSAMHWDYEQEEAVEAFRVAARRVASERSNPELATFMRKRRLEDMRQFSPKAVGELMKTYLRELRA